MISTLRAANDRNDGRRRTIAAGLACYPHKTRSTSSIRNPLPGAKKIAKWLVRITFLPPMPKPTARSKTRKAVAKRFKVTGTGKVMRRHASKRHLLVSKSSKRRRNLGKAALVDKTDTKRILMNLPFH